MYVEVGRGSGEGIGVGTGDAVASAEGVEAVPQATSPVVRIRIAMDEKIQRRIIPIAANPEAKLRLADAGLHSHPVVARHARSALSTGKRSLAPSEPRVR